MGTAWAGPAMLASIATSGGADAAGSTAYEAAMMQAQFSGGHAVGGTQFGGMAMVGERGPELSLAAVPRQIFQTSHTTNNNNGGNTVHVHIHGGDQATILRTIRNATTNSSGGSH
jgi:cyanophycinase-like exopeptidase